MMKVHRGEPLDETADALAGVAAERDRKGFQGLLMWIRREIFLLP